MSSHALGVWGYLGEIPLNTNLVAQLLEGGREYMPECSKETPPCVCEPISAVCEPLASSHGGRWSSPLVMEGRMMSSMSS